MDKLLEHIQSRKREIDSTKNMNQWILSLKLKKESKFLKILKY